MSTQHTHRARAARDLRSGTVVDALVERGLLPEARRDEALEVIDHALARQGTPASLRRRLFELAGYVGAALVVSAAGIFFATQWDALSGLAKVGLLAGIAILLTAAGLGVAGAGAGGPARGLASLRSGARPIHRRLVGVLFVGAAATAGGAVGVQVARLVDDPASNAPALWGLACFTLLTLAGYLLTPSVVGQVSIAVGVFATVPIALDVVGETTPIGYGLVVLAVGLIWVVLAERGLWREVGSARVVGCVLSVVGAQITVADTGRPWVGYLALLVVAVAAFAVYVRIAAWPYLATGVLAVTLVVPQALLDWTADSLGPAGVLLVAGLSLLGASLFGLRLRQEVEAAPRSA
jgi:hypothetical protein